MEALLGFPMTDAQQRQLKGKLIRAVAELAGKEDIRNKLGDVKRLNGTIIHMDLNADAMISVFISLARCGLSFATTVPLWIAVFDGMHDETILPRPNPEKFGVSPQDTLLFIWGNCRQMHEVFRTVHAQDTRSEAYLQYMLNKLVDYIYFLTTALRLLKLRVARFRKIFEVKTWAAAEVWAIPVNEVREMIKNVGEAQAYLTEMREFWAAKMGDVKTMLGQFARESCTAVDDLFQNMPPRHSTQSSVDTIIQRYGFAPSKTTVASLASNGSRPSPEGASSSMPPRVANEVVPEVSDEELAAFHERLRGLAAADPSLQQVVQRVDSTFQTDRAALLASLRRMYGDLETTPSFDQAYRYRLRPTGSVAMRIPYIGASENRTRPHVSISRRNGPGYHITSADRASHYYFDRHGALRWSDVPEAQRGLGVPQAESNLSERARSFLARLRR